MPEFYRVRDNETKAEYNAPVLLEGLTELDEPTHDIYGSPIPVKYPEPTKAKATSKEAAK